MISDTIFGADPGALHGSALLTAVGREANIAHVRAFRSRDWLDPAEAAEAGHVNESVERNDRMEDPRVDQLVTDRAA